MEVLGEARRQRCAADEVENVREIVEPVRGCQPGGELELDESRQRQEREFFPTQRRRRRIRKRDRFGLTVSWKPARAEDVDLDVVLGIEKLPRSRGALRISSPEVL